jgi:undecaprenol kinase
MSFLHSIPKSFIYAWSGINTAIKNEPNFRMHLMAIIAVSILGFLMKLSMGEWAVIVLTVAMVITLELINTSLEAIVNMVSPQMSEGAKIAKDTAAAAVLIGAITAVLVGLLIFVPKLF